MLQKSNTALLGYRQLLIGRRCLTTCHASALYLMGRMMGFPFA